ncbi:MAG: 16S rRNA (adenine(1518)-N(6)/adenine(1519)-N(6))-dimethyltransferase RsmA [Anaerolineales bacterium]
MPEANGPPNVRALMRRFGIRSRRKLGQNFMVDPRALRKVITAAQLTGGETVLEIGAGVGSLTWRLAHHCARVVAVEIDERLIPALEYALSFESNVEIVAGDILEMDVDEVLGNGPYSVVANIPYYITSALIRRLMESRRRPECLVLSVQKEVAERIVAGPGEMSLLALSVQVYGEPELRGRIPASAFYPQPKVDSAVLRIAGYPSPRVPQALIEPLFVLARAGFGQKRKQLHNALAKNLGKPNETVLEWLSAAGVRPEQRAQELSIDNWLDLAQAMASSED